MKVRVIVLRTAGTNCDRETAYAFERSGAATELVHINQLVRRERSLREYDILAIPGGFSYGDDIAAGKILANELAFRLTDEVRAFVAARKPVIGICNGFQVLAKAGLLPSGAGALTQRVTLTFNDSGKFEDRWVMLKVNRKSHCLFSKGIDELITLPVAHGEGKFYAPEDTLQTIAQGEQIVFTYVDACGYEAGYPANPNGSLMSIAGICNPEGTILGMMPHPERYSIRYQHPHWTRDRGASEEGVGLKLFRNAVRYCKG